MATEDLFSQTGRLTSRIQQLEAAPPLPPPPPPPRPATAPPQPPPRWTNPFDLNLAPHPVTRTSATTGERPSGHRNDNTHRADGGGILGSHPPRPVTGIAFVADPPPDHRELARDSSSRNPHMPKLHFPVFDGDNPRLWRDRCEMYFEALNFKGVAANWLQTLERKRCVSDWEEFCKKRCSSILTETSTKLSSVSWIPFGKRHRWLSIWIGLNNYLMVFCSTIPIMMIHILSLGFLVDYQRKSDRQSLSIAHEMWQQQVP